MKKIAFVFTCAILAISCNAQEKNENKNPTIEDSKTLTKTDNQAIPKENWVVKKKYDENGNLIQYDSTYTWSYTNSSGDSLWINPDSMMMDMNRYFDSKFPSIFKHQFHNYWEYDTIPQKDFFRKDFFQESWRRNFYDMENLMKEMDSVRNKFFEKSFEK